MSREEIETVLEHFDKSGYSRHVMTKYRLSSWKSKWDKSMILQRLEKAFSNGFVGIHFIPAEYEGCIGQILLDYVGEDHFIAYRICKQHQFIVLEPNFHKLKQPPSKYITSSYTIDPAIHASQHADHYVDLCFE